jgi:hypothetical protein
MPRARLIRTAGRGVLPLALLVLPAGAGASGPYLVDDAAITPAGAGQVEAWLSLARGNTILNVIPATSLAALPNVEWSVALNGTRVLNAEDAAVAVQAKWQLRPATGRRAGLALVGNLAADPVRARATSALAYAAVTVPAGDRLLLHANLGWARTLAAPRGSALTWGARAEAALIPDRLAAHAELFGSSATGRGFQLGLRPTNRRGTVDLELIFGRNLTGERRHWVTLGFATRF